MLNDFETIFMRQITQSNEMLQNRFSMNANHHLDAKQRLMVAYLLARIDENDTDFKAEKISLKEFASFFGIKTNGGKQQAQIKKSLENIIHTGFWIFDKENKKEKYFQWIEDVEVDWENKCIELKLHHGLKKYLLGVTNNYTRYQLGTVTKFKRKYTWFLYDYFYSYLSEKKCIIDIENVIKKFGFSTYHRWKDIERYVIIPSIEEINKTSDVNVRYKTEIYGKKIRNVIFYIRRKKEGSLSMEQYWNEILQKASKTSDILKEKGDD